MKLYRLTGPIPSSTIGSNDGRGSIYGLDPADIKNIMNVSEGTTLRGESDAIVGATIASRFDLKIGTRIKIGEPNISVTRPVIRVVGILPAAGLSSSNGINTDNAIIVSDTWYTGQFGGGNVYDQVNVYLKDVSTLTEVEDAIDKKVNRNKDVVRISRFQFKDNQYLFHISLPDDVHLSDWQHITSRRCYQYI